MKGPIAKYSVLRPYPRILALSRSFKSAPNRQNYTLAVDQDFGLRKYRVKVESFEKSLKQAQWRYECLAPIVNCMYVSLLSPECFRQTDIEMYLSHMELKMSDFEHLLLQQAVYLILKALSGYEVLLERYRKVSVNEQTIGVGSNG